MASPHPFHERAGPVSDTVGSFSSASAPAPRPFRPPAPSPRPFRLRTPPPPSTYAFCSLAVSLDSMVKMAS
jgi:hypothetical protein